VCSDVDLYFAPFDNVFTVTVDPVTGIHSVSIDPTYRYEHQYAPTDRPPRSTEFDVLKHRGSTIFTESVKVRTRRDLDKNATVALEDDEVTSNSSSSEQADNVVYRLIERTADEFVTFVSVPHPNTFLIVRGVRNRFWDLFSFWFYFLFLVIPVFDM